MFGIHRPSHVIKPSSLAASQLCDQTTFYSSFYRDLQCARTLVVIESPFITQRRIISILPLLSQLRERQVKIVVNTKPFNEHNSSMVEQVMLSVGSLQDMGVIVLMTGGHHRKVAIVDDILYEGSLNILSQNDSCELMRRIQGKESVREMLKFINLEKWCK